MNLKPIRPNAWNVVLTILAGVLYYYLTLMSTLQKCALVSDKVYTSYSFLFGKCGQTPSLSYSVLSLVISVLFVPAVYILVTYVVQSLKNRGP